MRQTRPLLIFALAFLAGPLAAADLSDRLDNACYTELSFFCQRVPARLDSRLKCLRERSESLTARCVTGIKAIHDAIEAAKTAEAGPGAPPDAAPGKSAPKPALPADMEARLTGFEGAVSVHLAGSPDGQFINAEMGMPLQAGDAVRTGSGGKAELVVNGESIIQLGGGADLQVVQLEPKKTQWRLSIGGLVAKIKSLAEGQEMNFVTPSAVAAIRGTELWIKHENDDTGVGVFDEGKVTVTSAGGGAPVYLKPNQQTSVAKGKPPEPAKPLSVKPETRKLVEEARKRGVEVKKDWKPIAPQARKDLRQELAKRPPVASKSAPTPAPKAPAKAAEPAKPAAKAEPKKPAAPPAKAEPKKAAEPAKAAPKAAEPAKPEPKKPAAQPKAAPKAAEPAKPDSKKPADKPKSDEPAKKPENKRP